MSSRPSIKALFLKDFSKKVSCVNLWFFSAVTSATQISGLLSKLNRKTLSPILDICVTSVPSGQRRLQVYCKQTSGLLYTVESISEQEFVCSTPMDYFYAQHPTYHPVIAPFFKIWKKNSSFYQVSSLILTMDAMLSLRDGFSQLMVWFLSVSLDALF